jgi:autotransporter-associated beta strand protein
LIPVLRPGPGTHIWRNDSTNPVIIHPNVQILNGGGAAGHVINFQGMGDFHITNALRLNSGPTATLQWDSTGTTIWASDGGNGTAGSTNIFNTAQGPIVINTGTVIVKMPRLIPNTPGANTVTHDGTLLRFDSPAANTTPDTIVRAFSGSGPIEFNDGIWTLTSPNSTISGSIALNGGQVTVGGTEVVGVSGPLGVGSTISLNGAILGYSANNTFDYSGRFSTAASQQYKIDTAGQSVTFSNNLSSSGGTLTKLGGGTLTLAGNNSYSGLTTVSNGTLALQGPKTGTGSITVDDAGTLGIFEADGQVVTPGTLTLGSSAGASLEYDNMTNRTSAPLAPSAIAFAGTQTISINSGIFTTTSSGRTNPLLSWTSGSAPATVLGSVDGGGGVLNTNGNSIEFVTTSVALIWTGTNGPSWNAVNNWTEEGDPNTYADPEQVVFNDTAAGDTNVTISAAVVPEAVVVNNNSLIYSVTSSGANNIGGSARLSKSGSGMATLSGGVNTYTGVTTLKGGTLSVGVLADGGSASDIGAASSSVGNLVFKGGTLRYSGVGTSANRLFTVTTSGGTIDASGSGPLNLSNPGQIGLGGVLTLSGSNTDTNTLACSLISSGSLTKNGTGKWILTGTNTYGGGTIVNAGILQVGASPSGTIGNGPVQLNNGTALIFKRTGTVNVPGVISGNGYIDVIDTGTVILENNNTYSGPTTINAGTLQVGNGGPTGAINGGGGITNNAMLIFNTTGTFTYFWPSAINGPGNVIVRGGGHITAQGANTYTGWTLIEANSTFQPCKGNEGQLLSSVVTNNGTLTLVRQDLNVFIYSNNIVGSGRVVKDANNNNDSEVNLLGANSYAGGTIIAAGGVVVGDGFTPGVGSIGGFVIFTNSLVQNDVVRRIVFNRSDVDVTFGGTISGVGNGVVAQGGYVEQRGTNTMLTLTANNSHIGGARIIDTNSTLQVGNGGANGAIGTGPVQNAGRLVFNRGGNLSVGTISGAGSVVKLGIGTVYATNANSYAGNTTVSNGTLVLRGNLGGNVTLAGGNLAPGGLGGVGTLTNAGALNMNSGTIVITLNKSLVQSNSFVSAGSISYTGGGLKLLNYGPALTVGDKFTLFNQAILGGAGIPINSPGFTVANNLALDGSVTVTAVAVTPLVLTQTQSAGQVVLTWPVGYIGLVLQGQTNSGLGSISANWAKVIGSDLVNSVTNSINKGNKSVFYRLAPY